jgi:hypothetical protein
MLHHLSRTLVPGIALLLAVATPAPFATAGSTVAVDVAPTPVVVQPGDVFSVEYRAASVPANPGIGGYVLSVQWNPAMLEMTSFTDSGWVTGGNNIVICGAPIIDNSLGQGVLFCATVPLIFGPGVSTSAPRALASSSFRALAPGITVLDLTGSTLEGPAREPIPATLTNGSATVEAPATSTPVPVGETPTVVVSSPSPIVPGATELVPPGSTIGDPATLSNIGPPRVGDPGREETTGSTTPWALALTAVGVVLLTLGLGVRRGIVRASAGRRASD